MDLARAARSSCGGAERSAWLRRHKRQRRKTHGLVGLYFGELLCEDVSSAQRVAVDLETDGEKLLRWRQVSA